jgi:asparagine synthase (glutamine-hydrolysing)
LPDKWRIRRFTQKYILRAAMKDDLPREILHRPKVGFRVPVNEWFRGPMRSFVRDRIGSAQSLSRELFDRGEIEQLLVEHENGRQNHEKILWALINLELFNERYALEQRPAETTDYRLAARTLRGAG